MCDNTLNDIGRMLDELDARCSVAGNIYNSAKDILLDNKTDKIDKRTIDELFASVNNAQWQYVQIESLLEKYNLNVNNFYKDHPDGVERYNDMSGFTSFMWKSIAVGYRSLVVGG